MSLSSNCLRARIYVGETDLAEHKPLYETIVLKARERGIAGATVFRGSLGFGHSSRLHTSKILRLSADLPIVIEIVDETKAIESFLDSISEVLGDGLVTLEEVRIFHHQGSPRND